jgi:hypothetical protein
LKSLSINLGTFEIPCQWHPAPLKSLSINLGTFEIPQIKHEM